jgi:hypothetical protein
MVAVRQTQPTIAPDYSSDNERAIIGSCLLNPDDMRVVYPQVRPEHFYNDNNRTIYNAMVATLERYGSIDYCTVADTLAESGDLDRIGGNGELTSIADQGYLISSGDVCPKIEILLKHAARRRIKLVTQRMLTSAYMGDGEAALSDAIQELQAAHDGLYPAPDIPVTKTLLHIMPTMTTLLRKVLVEQKMMVDGLIPEGVTLFVGKAKMGKSWFSLGLGLAVSTGGYALGSIPVEKGRVLYLSLEDNERRLQTRMRALVAHCPTMPDLSMFHYQTEWRRMDEGGAEDLEAWVRANPDTRMVIIDTLAKIRPRRKKNADIYEEDYAAMEPIKRIADTYGISIVVVHHYKKLAGDDWYDQVSGSTGLVGAADGVIGLMRDRGSPDAVLKASGRDIMDAELAIRFDGMTCSWSILGEASEVAHSKERAPIIDYIRKHGASHYKRLAEDLGEKESTMKSKLSRMCADGDLFAMGNGMYQLSVGIATSATDASSATAQLVQPLQPVPIRNDHHQDMVAPVAVLANGTISVQPAVESRNDGFNASVVPSDSVSGCEVAPVASDSQNDSEYCDPIVLGKVPDQVRCTHQPDLAGDWGHMTMQGHEVAICLHCHPQPRTANDWAAIEKTVRRMLRQK